MSEQAKFDFTQAHARASDPSTSHAAARSVEATDLECRVLNCLRARYPDGLTSSELSHRLDLARVSVSPRLAPLVRKGLACDSGLRRNGPSGRAQIVWKINRGD